MEPRNEGFWGWVERHVLELQEDPSKRERWFKVAWFVSTAFVILGFLVILATSTGRL